MMVPGVGVEPTQARGPRDFKVTGKRQRTQDLAKESEEGRGVRGLWTPRWTPVHGRSEPTVASGLYRLAMDAGVPVGPPHRSRVVASRLAPSFAATSLSVAVYPTVIATTSNAPTRRGGLGTGMSNQRHPAPIATPRSRPSTILTIVTSLLPQALAADEPRT